MADLRSWSGSFRSWCLCWLLSNGRRAWHTRIAPARLLALEDTAHPLHVFPQAHATITALPVCRALFARRRHADIRTIKSLPSNNEVLEMHNTDNKTGAVDAVTRRGCCQISMRSVIPSGQAVEAETRQSDTLVNALGGYNHGTARGGGRRGSKAARQESTKHSE